MRNIDISKIEKRKNAYSRIDYSSTALVSWLKVAKQSIQFMINTTARLITGVNKYDNITLVLKELHWLKIYERIEFEIAL